MTKRQATRRGEEDAAVDTAFAVDFVYRLRFTDDVFDPTNRTLVDLFPKPGARPNRMVAFVDRGVADCWPTVDERIAAYAAHHGLELAAEVVPVQGGEACKNDEVVFKTAVRTIHDAGICRQSFVLVVGGGAVLDAVGFAAATAHRGVRLIRVPTTTLAQADGGLGVKNGINAFGKKNFLGAFATPWAVVNDRSFLDTLSDQAYRSGFSEAVKVGLIKDASLYHQVARDAHAVVGRDPEAALPIIKRSALLHYQHIVGSGDPFELTASRPLDFGHWSAHKLEQMTDFAVSHGDAVAIGVAVDVLYSSLAGMISAADAKSILDCLQRLQFKLHHPALDQTGSLLEGLDEFREHLGGDLTITLLQGIGDGVDVHEIDPKLVTRAVEELADRQ